MNAHVPMTRGVSAAMLAQFDLSIEEELRHAREMLGRHEHDAKRMEVLELTARTMREAHEQDAARLAAFVAYLETQKSERQQQGSTVSEGRS